MKYEPVSVLAFLALAACSSGGVAAPQKPAVSVTSNLAPPSDLYNVKTDPNVSRAVAAVFTTTNPTAIVANGETGQSQISSDDNGHVTFTPGGSTTPYTLTWDSGSNAYVGTAPVTIGNVTAGEFVTLKIYDDGNKPGLFVGELVAFDPQSSNPNQLTYAALVNQPTTAAELATAFPAGRYATYNGTVEVVDQTYANTAGGSIKLNADFTNKTISGAINIDAGTTFGATTFGIASAPITPGTYQTNFSSSLTGFYWRQSAPQRHQW